jgi:hypothetical protein
MLFLKHVFNDLVQTYSGFILSCASYVTSISNDEFKRMWNETVIAIAKYYPGTCLLKLLRKAARILSISSLRVDGCVCYFVYSDMFPYDPPRPSFSCSEQLNPLEIHKLVTQTQPPSGLTTGTHNHVCHWDISSSDLCPETIYV